MASSRRRFLGLLGATGGAGLAGCTTVDVWSDGSLAATDTDTATTPAGPHSWPSFHHDRRNSGHAATTGPTPPLSEQWPYRESHFQPSSSESPAVVDGTAYVTSADTVYALQVTDGTANWEFAPEVDGPRRNPPFASGTPAVTDGTVYVGTGLEWTVYALAAADGSEQWRYTAASSGRERPSPTVVDDTVYIGGGAMHAISAADGTEQWTFDPGGTIRSAPAVVDDTVFIGSKSGSVYALSTSDGTERWHYDTGESVYAAPTVVDGSVYVGTGATYDDRQPNERDPHRVVALAAADGSERWTFETDHEVVVSAAVADDTVYVGSWDEHVYALAAADGTERWRHELAGKVWHAAPVVADDTVYVGSYVREASDVLYALAAPDGAEMWTYEIDGYWSVTPAVVDGTIYLGPMALE